MDIICVMWLLYRNGKIAESRGYKPMKYRLMTLGLCFGLEILGSVSGMVIALNTNPEQPTLKWAYILGITGIIVGAFMSRMFVLNATMNGNQAVKKAQVWNQGGQYRMMGENSYVGQEEQLTQPATVRIVNEYYWNETRTDLFFLNGIPICTLQPGNEHTFLINSAKNVFSIGRPAYPNDDVDHSIKFVAADKGYIEIVVKDSKIVKDKFKNIKSK